MYLKAAAVYTRVVYLPHPEHACFARSPRLCGHDIGAVRRRLVGRRCGGSAGWRRRRALAYCTPHGPPSAARPPRARTSPYTCACARTAPAPAPRPRPRPRPRLQPQVAFLNTLNTLYLTVFTSGHCIPVYTLYLKLVGLYLTTRDLSPSEVILSFRLYLWTRAWSPCDSLTSGLRPSVR